MVEPIKEGPFWGRNQIGRLRIEFDSYNPSRVAGSLCRVVMKFTSGCRIATFARKSGAGHRMDMLGNHSVMRQG